MNKRFLTALLTGAFFLASTSMFVACKDYDDDIQNLQQQIDKNAQAIKDIQNQIQNGYLITSVNPITNGVEIVFSGNGGTYKITNGKDGVDGVNGTNGIDGKDGKDGVDGKDGKDGTVWTIGDDGYWYKDGVKTDYKAIGQDGKDGKDGKDGEDGKDGKDGKDGTSATASTIYYVPNADTGCFDKYEDGKFVEHTNISFVATGAITAVKDKDLLTLYGVEGGEGEKKVVTISLSGTLKSLVFIPHFYLDGIETIEYPWIGDSTLVKSAPAAAYTQETHHKKHIQNTATMHNWLPDNLSENPETTNAAREEIIYGPVIGIDYEMNPSNAALTWDANTPHYNVLEPAVVYANTRAAAATLNVTSPKTYGRYTEDKDVFGIKNSRSTSVHMGAGNSGVPYLQAGLKIAKPEYLEPYPTSGSENGGYLPADLDASYTMPNGFKAWYDWYKDDKDEHKDTDNTIALQLDNIENGSVTSDYALVIPSRIRLEGLIWSTKPMYVEPGFGPAAGGVTGDEKGWYSTDDQIFVWDSPKEALDNKIGAALELPVDDDFIDLKKYIGIRILKENVIKRKVTAVDWAAKEFTSTEKDPNGVAKFYGYEEDYDLHYEFELVDYETDTNITHDSRYATFTDTKGLNDAKDGSVSKTGRIRALTVDEIGNSSAAGFGSTTAVDREPLVRILVKNTAGKVLLDGYILIHITNTKANLNITTYPTTASKFNYCDSVMYKTNWSQFSKYVLQDAMKNFEKNTFDYFYWADCLTGGTVDPADKPFVTAEAKDLDAYDGHKTYSMKIFNFGSDIYGNGGAPEAKGSQDAKEETSNAFEDKPLGVVRYFPNADGQTNHKWEWSLSADEVEYLTKGKTEAVTVTRWIRFQAKTFQEANENLAAGTVQYTQDNYNAPYPYIWVKMTITITRDPLQAKFTKKIDNFWYNWNSGAADGWSGYLVDIEAPRDGKTIKNLNWYGNISHTLHGNVPVLTKYSDGTTALANAYQTGLYYFAPKTIEITGLSGRKYTITPQSSGTLNTDGAWNLMYNRYVVLGNTFTKVPATGVTATVKATSEHYKWDEATLKSNMEKYAINCNTGVFKNNILYVYDHTSKNYYQIAKITKQEYVKAAPDADEAGQIQLFHWLTAEDATTGSLTKTDFENWRLYDVLNAIGYEANNANINKELRSWLGFIGRQCTDNVAFYVEQAQYDDTNVATVLNSWKRPINLPENNPDDALDAKTNENTVYMVDNLKMFDWRGDKPATDGYMYDGHYWFWGYYNVKGIAVNLDPAKVQVDLNDGNGFVTLSSVTSKLRLRALGTPTEIFTPNVVGKNLWGVLAGATYWEFPDLTSYNSVDKESAIETLLGVNPANVTNKAKFGGFYYENDALTLTKFTLKFPVAIRYEWGWVYNSTLTWKIDTTHGN